MKLEETHLTVKETAESMGISTRSVMRMLYDGRLKGELVGTPLGKIWYIHPVSIARLIVQKENLNRHRYPRANKKEEARHD